MKQKIITPPISQCHCGANAHPIDWDYNGLWVVMCDKNHTMTKPCGTQHRAICRWNNRIKAMADGATHS